MAFLHFKQHYLATQSKNDKLLYLMEECFKGLAMENIYFSIFKEDQKHET